MDNQAVYRIGFANGMLFAAIFFVVLTILLPIRIKYQVYRPTYPARDRTAEAEPTTENDV